MAEEFVALQQAIENLRKTMLAGDSAALQKHAADLAGFQQTLFNDVRETFESLQAQDDTAPLQVEDLPAALRDRFIGVNGKFLLQIYPKHDVWQRGNQEKFVADLRTVDPDATGTPVQLYEYETLLKNSYVQAAWYSLGAIVVLVWFHFRSLGAVVLSLLPVGIGTLWLVGLMGWLDIPFNPANIITLPLVIGIGVTNGIHILNRFAEERTPEHSFAQHRQSRAGVGLDGHRRFRQFDSCQTSWYSQPGLRHVHWHCDVYDCRTDISCRRC